MCTRGVPGAPRGPPAPPGGPPVPRGRAPPAGHTRDTAARMVALCCAQPGASPSAPQTHADRSSVPTAAPAVCDNTTSSAHPLRSVRAAHALIDAGLRHSPVADTLVDPPGPAPALRHSRFRPAPVVAGLPDPLSRCSRDLHLTPGGGKRGSPQTPRAARGPLSASDTPPCGGCISPPGGPLRHPENTPKNVHFWGHFWPWRCETERGWGGSAHYPDPTAQSAPRSTA